MSYTTDRNLPKLPSGPVDWVAAYNDLADKIELGFTIKRTAGEALVEGDPFYVKNDGKAWNATDATPCHGVWQSTSTDAEADGYGLVFGSLTHTGWTWTLGAALYVDSGGALSESPGNGPVAYAMSATKIFVCNTMFSGLA